MLILWNIWTVRNNVKHRGATFKSSTIIFKTMEHLQALSKGNLWKAEHLKGDLLATSSFRISWQPKPKPKKPTLVHWLKPPVGWSKLNTDGASRGNPGASGAGGILRNHLGEVLFTFQEPLGDTTNIQAELRALHRGLQICIERGFNNIWIELDALAIIQLILKPYQGAWQHQTLLQRIRAYLGLLETRITHIYREGNQAADFLANLACTSQHLTIFCKELTGKIRGIIRLDSLCIPYLRNVKE